MGNACEVKGQQSVAAITRKDGTVKTLPFSYLVYVNSTELEAQVLVLKRWLETLTGYRKTVDTQIGELVELWDAEHTQRIREEMANCRDTIDDAIEKLKVAVDDMTLLANVTQDVFEWLRAHPEYNRPSNGYTRKGDWGMPIGVKIEFP